MNFGSTTGSGGKPAKRRVMVVADPGREAAGALQWALSHAVLEHDDLLLLHLDHLPSTLRRPPSSFSAYFRRAPAANGGNAGAVTVAAAAAAMGTSSSMGEMEGDFLEVMRAKCEVMQPKVKVQVEKVEMEPGKDKDKATAILAHCGMRGVDLLVVGQPRRSLTFLRLSGGTASKEATAEFLIENSKCLCVGVQKKGQNAGYLLNTKSHKNFWLLA